MITDVVFGKSNSSKSEVHENNPKLQANVQLIYIYS